jgi:hypothetical protein
VLEYNQAELLTFNSKLLLAFIIHNWSETVNQSGKKNVDVQASNILRNVSRIGIFVRSNFRSVSVVYDIVAFT